jgi:hypothetical protein
MAGLPARIAPDTRGSGAEGRQRSEVVHRADWPDVAACQDMATCHLNATRYRHKPRIDVAIAG